MALRRSAQFYVGVDIGGSKILTGLFSSSLLLRGTLKIKTKANLGKEAVIERVERAVRDLLSKQGVPLKQIRAIGLCLLYTSPSPRDRQKSRMPSSA